MATMVAKINVVVILMVILTAALNLDFAHCGRIRHRHSNRHKMNGTSMRSTRVLQRSSSVATPGVPAGGSSKESVESDVSNLIYSPWSEWSPCSRKCKQERSRQCNAPWRCGNVVTKEERSCAGPRCKRKPFTVVDGDRQEASHRDLPFGAMKTMAYAAWSEWSPCTRGCRTRRYRTCKMEAYCGKSAIQEDAFCYVKGTVCERMFKRLKKNPEALSESKEQQLPKEPSTHTAVVEECGVTNTSNAMALRIIGGQPVNRGRWPWQAAILNRFKDAFCGGTLIAPQWVMTAAHCARKRLHVRLGEHALNTQDGSEQEYRVVHTYVHPDYDPETVDNDIALLKLSSPATLDKRVQLACLPKQGAPLPQDKLCTILGWGKEKHMAAAGTEVLREAKVPIVDIKNCLEVYEDYYITGNMFCAGYRRGRVDSCAGDSGGPLLCETENRWHVFGITSFGEGCGRKGKYGIYAKVPNYITWMETTMEESSDVL